MSLKLLVKNKCNYVANYFSKIKDMLKEIEKCEVCKYIR